ncbi:hypothetical protein ROZALSC1DRAFT_23441, partial [Rozella allomycis CSF55]
MTSAATGQYEIKVYKALARSYYEQKLRDLLQNENIEEPYMDVQTEILKNGLLYEYKRCEKQETNLNFDIDEVNKFHSKIAKLFCKRISNAIQQFPGPLSKLRDFVINELNLICESDETRLFKFPFPSYFNDGLEWLENNRNQVTEESNLENLLSSFRLDKLCKVISVNGCQPWTRSECWKLMLKSSSLVPVLKDLEKSHFKKLTKNLATYELTADKMIRIQSRSISEDDGYFVFEDLCNFVMLIFSRDDSIASSYLNYFKVNAQDSKENLMYPPSGLPLFDNLCRLVAPLCFINDSVENIYAMFKALFVKYFCNLQTMTFSSNHIYTLLQKIETKLMTLHPDFVNNLTRSIKISIFGKLHSMISVGFAGYLEVHNVLILWDLMIANDSIEILALFSYKWLLKKKDKIMEAKDASVKDINWPLKIHQVNNRVKYSNYVDVVVCPPLKGSNYCSPDKAFCIYSQYESSDTNMLFRIAAKTKGWAGLAFGSSITTPGTDVAAGWYDPQFNEIYITDRTVADNGTIVKDDVQNVKIQQSFYVDTPL